MAADKDYEAFLNEFSDGNRERFSTFLTILANQPVYIPMISSAELGGESSGKVVRIATFPSKGRKYVPVFTSETFFYNWSDLRFQSFAVFAGDLLLTLPKNTWVLLNPGRYNSIELGPDDLRFMSEVEPEAVAMKTPFDAVGSAASEQEAASVADAPAEAETVAGFAEESTAKEELAPQQEELREALQQATATIFPSYLSALFESIPQIHEAYYFETPDASTQAVLGVLAPKLDVETRFRIISYVAELSKAHFGYAGAVDVYDDLDNEISSSWELFKTITPFYVRGAVSEQREESLQERISAEHSPAPEAAPEPKAARKRPRFLGGLRSPR